MCSWGGYLILSKSGCVQVGLYLIHSILEWMCAGGDDILFYPREDVCRWGGSLVIFKRGYVQVGRISNYI